MPDVVLKCYRGSCSNGAHALCYNRVTHGMYCLQCAKLIDRSSPSDLPGGSLFPLLHLPTEVHVQLMKDWQGGSYHAGIILARPNQVT